MSGASGDYAISTSGQTSVSPIWIIHETGEDAKRCFTDGVITSDSSADARSGKAVKITPTSASVPIGEKVGNVKIPSAATDLTLKIYLKDDASFNGSVHFIVLRNGKYLSRTVKTPTTSYVQESVVIAAADLVANEYLDLYVLAIGTAGSVWVDDFSADQ